MQNQDTKARADAGVPPGRMAHLDTLRAFAITIVMFEHFSGLAHLVPIGAGTMGVGLFFVLSGFLITNLLLQGRIAGERPGPQLRDFYIRRFFRLAPAYAVVLTVIAVVGLEDMEYAWPWHAAYLSNIYMALGGERNNFWTLAVEEQFYLLWPAVLLFLPWRYRLHAAAGLIVASIAFKAGSYLAGVQPFFMLLPYKMDLLGVGCVLAVVVHHLNVRSDRDFEWLTPGIVRMAAWPAGIAFAVAVLLWFLFGVDGAARVFFNDLLCSVAYGFLVLVAARGVTGPLKPVFDSPVLQYVGRISYGLYLWHTWVKDLIRHFVPDVPDIVLGPATLTATFAICILSWNLLEKPAMALGRRLTARDRTRRRMERRTAPAQSAARP